MKVLVAVDDSQFSVDAIEELGARPWWGDTKFLIFHVAPVPTVQQWEIWGMAVDWQLRDKFLAEAQTLVDDRVRLLKKLVGDNIEIAGKVAEGQANPSDCIVQEASEWDADLIVTGSHGSVEIIKSVKRHEIATKQKNDGLLAVN
jgi:nucleotide-binding universal stress UspA family protein